MERTLRIRALRVRAVELPLARPVETAAGTMHTTPLVLVDLSADGGVTGRSYLRSYTPLALRPLARLVQGLEELVTGAPTEPAALEATLKREFRLLGTDGLMGLALAGVDMALWDAIARAQEVPLAVLLGGRPGSLPAYASLRSMSPQAAAREAEEMLALGFDTMKVKVGRAGLADDLATIRAVRATVGDGVELMVDYNQALSVEDAIERARVLDAEGIAWIEEPTRASDFEGHARIAAAAATAIQLGENWNGLHDLERSVAAAASDLATFDVQKIGGVSGWLRAAALAKEHALPVSSHAFPEYSSHLLAVTPTRHRLEYLDHAGPILRERIRVQGGRLIVPDHPGAGLDWNEDALARLPAL